MMMSAVHFLVNVILSIATLMFLLRFLMQAFKASFHNPIGQIVMALTDFAVKPVRRFVPSWKKVDLSTLLLAFLAQFLLMLVVAKAPVWPNLIGLSLLGVARTVIDLFFYAIFIQVILSWVNPHTPIAPLLNTLTRPILRPIQKIIPPISGIDFAPFVAIILLQMLNTVIIRTLESRLSLLI